MKTLPAWIQALPMGGVFLVFFVMPLLLVGAVSFWPQNEYTLEPGFTLDNYVSLFQGCFGGGESGELCTTFKTYLSTLKFCGLVWLITLVIGFTLAYFVAFHVPSVGAQTVIFTVMTIPFWTSNVIRMISWIPLLGRNGWVNQTLQSLGLTNAPLDWLLYSDFAVVLAFVHLNTTFMMVPIFNSMMKIDRSLIEAADDAGATAWQTLWNVIVPLCRTGILIGSIFVITLVMGDFVTVGVMGGQQIASVGKTIQVQTSYLQFPLAAANAVVLLGVVLLIIVALNRLVDLRKEL
ncbi:ABC transporter permease [Aquabacterium sp. CECT 9606]|uniref:ABC transporter permease n=1 Tax=Aquabacterium sp. CECT 9606 TaxID=2845822 RepID=UPI001E5280B0|nr:ABC transporter permease [Aquabacterium sp. CECT 9606]CAH0350659.1 Spermidine/putrescine transport system permease protein PotB [Aquabacterium sp. CECT 9606]